MRIVTGTLGVALMAIGAVLLLAGGQAVDVALWLAGAIVLHDGLVAPLVLAVGLLLASVPARGTVRGALVVAGSLTVIALPPMLRPGAPANASALPLDYVRNWLILMGAVVVLTGVLRGGVLLVRRVSRRRVAER
ncbi:hypothetical protein ACIHCQ_31345 [Streptomyces sp. NPDC052236]|uniref:hypothetical protein n=1 Tax=Streptomyces sp. NPDC052236 TaxID=3365686 RepID=UPI0037D1CD37